MSKRYFLLPLVILIVAATYWKLSGDMAGTTMLGVWGLAMALFGSILLPTVNDVGPTAPVDPDWEPRDHQSLAISPEHDDAGVSVAALAVTR